MLVARPLTAGSSTFALRDESGEVARLRPPGLFADGVLALGAVRYGVAAEGLSQGRVRLSFQGAAVAAARRETLSSTWAVDVATDLAPGAPARLRATRSFGGGTTTVLVDEVPVGTVRRRGVFTRRAEVALPAAWPLAVRAFVVLLVLIDWSQGS